MMDFDFAFNLPRPWLRAWRAGDTTEQVIVLLLALLGAWLALFLWKRFLRPQDMEERWGVARQKVGIIVFPFFAWAGIWLGIWLGQTQNWYHTGLLKQIAAPLLAALLMIRLLVHTLRQVFGQKAWVLKSERWMSWLIWIGFVLHTVGILQDIWALLDNIEFKFGKNAITILSLLTAIVTIAISLLAALWLSSVVEKRLMQAQGLDLNTRVVLNKLSRALLLCTGFLFALQLAGIDLTLFAVFGGALGVGLGFGLQKIASNYISGFIILLDRSLRPGDVVIADNKRGQITEFTARYIVVKDLNGTEAIIPNDTLITSTVVNLSYTSPKIKINLPMMIAYHSDIQQALQILQECAQTQNRILADPPPIAMLQGFSELGVQLDLACWIADPQLGDGVLKSQLYLAILDRFKAAGIDLGYTKNATQTTATQQ